LVKSVAGTAFQNTLLKGNRSYEKKKKKKKKKRKKKRKKKKM
jgi:hypothetical protein